MVDNLPVLTATFLAFASNAHVAEAAFSNGRRTGRHLLGGAIAGIVIAIVAAVVIFAIIICLVFRRRRRGAAPMGGAGAQQPARPGLLSRFGRRRGPAPGGGMAGPGYEGYGQNGAAGANGEQYYQGTAAPEPMYQQAGGGKEPFVGGFGKHAGAP